MDGALESARVIATQTKLLAVRPPTALAWRPASLQAHTTRLDLISPHSTLLDLSAWAAFLAQEVNNGRLAMIGLFGILSEAKVPGSVPLLKGVIPSYSGEVMAPLAYSGPSFAEVHSGLF